MEKNILKQYHILNGDVLKDEFPKTLSGEIIVFRECLVDGPVNAENLKDFYALRAGFISKAYGCIEPDEYYIKAVPEIEKLFSIPDNSVINLWFEDDLFCQVNLWFILDILAKRNLKIYLIRPEKLTSHGFRNYSSEGLLALYSKKRSLDNISGLEHLWCAYCHGDNMHLLSMSRELKSFLPFIFNAVKAHIDRQRNGDFPGRPMSSLKKIIAELGTSDFGPVFKKFSKREFIYGFGDLQVKRLLDEMRV